MTDIRELYQIFLKSGGISTDSRTIQKDSIFFALKGEQFDANQFAAEALSKGAAYVVVDDPEVVMNDRYLLVKNSLSSLQQLAKFHRSNLDTTIIGITGTNGKTTSKELISSVLSTTFRTYATKGNFNNHVGVPVSLLEIGSKTEIAIIEMGANHPGEIAQLCEISGPDYGLITNIGKAHLEGFGNLEGVVKAKTELYQFIRDIGGKIFLNKDNPLLLEKAGNIPSITYGTSNNVDCRAVFVKNNPFLELNWIMNDKSVPLKTQLYGSYNFENVLAAVCIGSYFGVNHEMIKDAIRNYIPKNYRSQFENTGHNHLIIDSYNANPSSMKAALDDFRDLHSSDKMVILGDMLELGSESQKEHAKIIEYIETLNIAKVILVGTVFGSLSIPKSFLSFKDSTAASEFLKNHPHANYTILIKGSRGIKLEFVIPFL